MKDERRRHSATGWRRILSRLESLRGFTLRRGVAMILCAQACAIATPALANLGETYYVDGDRPVNGIGTESDPFNTLTAVPAGEGSSVFVAGILRESISWSGPRRGSIIRQWPDRRRAEIRGDVVVPPNEWTDLGEGVYAASIPALPASVVWNWDDNIDSEDRHFGHLRSVSTLEECRNLPGSWWFEPSVSVLHVHPPPGAHPPDEGDEYAWVRTGSGLTLLNGDDVTFEGLHFRLWSDPNPGSGYGMKIIGAIDCTVLQCVFEDCGFHSLGFVGALCDGNRMIGCVGRGLHGRSIHFVFYSGAGDITRSQAIDCEAHLYTILDWQGEPLDSGDRSGGYYTHTGSGALATDLEFLRCRAIGYEGAIGNAFGAGETTPPVADPRNVYDYPVRFVECIAEDCDYVNVEGRVAFIRCRLDFRRAAQSGGLSGTCLNFNRAGTQVALESCEIITRLNGASASRAIWAKNLGDRLYLLGVTFFDEFPQTATRSFIRMGEEALVVAEQCVFASSAPMYLTNGSAAHAPENFDFVNCWYDGIGPTWYSSSSVLNERSEWASLVDDQGAYDLNPEFAAPPENLAPALEGALWRARRPREGVSRAGIAGLAYDGRLGAHQFAWPIARVLASPCPNAGLLELSWSQANPEGMIAILYSRTSGFARIPPRRPCAGLALDLGAPTLVLAATARSDPSGAGVFSARIPRGVCGGFVQIVDPAACRTTNVVAID